MNPLRSPPNRKPLGEKGGGVSFSMPKCSELAGRLSDLPLGSRGIHLVRGQLRHASVLLLAVVCCGSTPLPLIEAEGPNPARLAAAGDPAGIAIPAETAVNTPVLVVVVSYGGGCIRKGSTDVHYGAGVVDLRPYDIFPPRDAVCKASLALNRHEVSLVFKRPGKVVVRVHGTRVSMVNGERRRERLIVSRTLLVR